MCLWIWRQSFDRTWYNSGMLDRYQLLKGRDEDGNRVYALLDADFEYIIGEGTLQEMKEFKEQREIDDRMLTWQ